MTRREFLEKVIATTTEEDLKEYAEAVIVKMAENAEKRKGKVSAKTQEKREQNEAEARRIAAEILDSEPKTATDVAAILGEDVKVQRASYLCRKAVELGVAAATEVKVPKRGTVKAYTKI